MENGKADVLTILHRQLEPHGLVVRGGFYPDESDGLDPGVGTVVLIGNVGSAMWRPFSEARPTGRHPMDEWTMRLLGPLADSLGVQVVYPFSGPPYYPFQRWAMRAEGLTSSPIGPLIHGKHGLWHAYRGALLIDERLTLPSPQHPPSPCESCATRPCLGACPVGAFSLKGYDVEACVAHVSSADGVTCRTKGCLARQACPVGTPYSTPQQAFHMEMFLRAHND